MFLLKVLNYLFNFFCISIIYIDIIRFLYNVVIILSSNTYQDHILEL